MSVLSISGGRTSGESIRTQNGSLLIFSPSTFYHEINVSDLFSSIFSRFHNYIFWLNRSED